MGKESYLIAITIGLFTGLLIIGALSILGRKPSSSQYPSNSYPYPTYPSQPNLPLPPINNPEPGKPEPEVEPEITTPEPRFKNYPPIRSINNLGEVLGDIESHMPAGHIYKDSDRITWGHETSHGIHSNLRNGESGNGSGRVNGFYVLKNRAVIIQEPNTTIQAAARLVPSTLRGGVYQLYMIQQARSWGDTPLYVFDEWVSYSNGSAVRADFKIQNRQETVQYMLEFNVYAICVAQAANTSDPQFKNFLMWHLARAMSLYEANKNIGDTSRSTEYWNKVRLSSDAESFRQYARQYFGPDWTKKVLGF